MQYENEKKEILAKNAKLNKHYQKLVDEENRLIEEIEGQINDSQNVN